MPRDEAWRRFFLPFLLKHHYGSYADIIKRPLNPAKSRNFALLKTL